MESNAFGCWNRLGDLHVKCSVLMRSIIFLVGISYAWPHLCFRICCTIHFHIDKLLLFAWAHLSLSFGPLFRSGDGWMVISIQLITRCDIGLHAMDKMSPHSRFRDHLDIHHKMMCALHHVMWGTTRHFPWLMNVRKLQVFASKTTHHSQ